MSELSRISIIFLLLCFTTKAYNQNFEGEIIYTNHFVSKMRNFTNEQLEAMIGTKQEYLISAGNYKTFLNGHSIVMQFYENKSNRIYNRTSKSDTLYWFDASTNTDTVISFEIKTKVGEILGNECDMIIIKTHTGITTIYYNAKYKVNSRLYKNHLYNNWAFYTSKTGALPLKIVIETNQFKMESTAIEIKKLRLEDDYFNIDPNTPLKKSL